MDYSLTSVRGIKLRKLKLNREGEKEMEKLERDHWSDLIMDSVGDDYEKAVEFEKQYRLWSRWVVAEIIIGVGVFGLMMLGIVFGMYWAGMDSQYPPGEKEITSVVFLWMGATLGGLCVVVRDGLEAKLRKRKDNIAYHWDKMGDDQCK